jgi:Spy/CpxP family protein refolding chaperone
MKAIRIATLAIALCAGITSVGAAQGQPEPGKQGRGGSMGGHLLKDITLTDAQKAQVKVIREKYVPQLVELRKAEQAVGRPDEATRAQMADLKSKQAAEIRAILTADQQAIFDRNLAEQKSHGGQHKSGR